MSALGWGKGQIYAPVVLFRYRLPNTLGRRQRTSALTDENKHSVCTGNEYLRPAGTKLETKLFNFTFPPWLIRRPWLELGYCAVFMLVKNRQPCFSSFIKAHSRSVTPSARRGKQARGRYANTRVTRRPNSAARFEVRTAQNHSTAHSLRGLSSFICFFVHLKAFRWPDATSR